MRAIKIVADSSANLLKLEQIPFSCAPLKIITAEQEFVDDETLNVAEMVTFFDTYKGKSQTSCPNPGDWIDAFDDTDEVFCVTITSGLSGSYNAALAAKQMYESENPDKRVCVIDSLSAGPELKLIVEKLQELIAQDLSYEEICDKIRAYTQNTGLLFMLESMRNLAANGRVSPAVAKIAGLLGIRVVGKASDAGTLEPIDKCRGESKALEKIVFHLQELGLQEGKVRIAHCQNPGAAEKLQKLIAEQFPKAQTEISKCTGLCSFYAEKGGMLIGFEKI